MLLKQLAMEPSMAERISPVLNEGLEWLESARTAGQGRWKELQTQFWAKTPDADTDDRSAVEVYMERLVSGRIEYAAIQDTLEVAMSAQAEQIVTWSIPQQLKSLPELDASPDRWLESDQAKSWLSQEIPGADAVSWRWEGIPFGDQGTWWTGKQPGIGTRYLWYSGPTDSKGSTASLLPVHDVPMAEIVRGFRPNA